MSQEDNSMPMVVALKHSGNSRHSIPICNISKCNSKEALRRALPLPRPVLAVDDGIKTRSFATLGRMALPTVYIFIAFFQGLRFFSAALGYAFSLALPSCSLCSVWLGVVLGLCTLQARGFARFDCAPGRSDD